MTAQVPFRLRRIYPSTTLSNSFVSKQGHVKARAGSLLIYIVLRYKYMDVSLTEYRALAEFRLQIRRFLHFSEEQARAKGLEPQQHQLLLAIRGLPADVSATIGELAARMYLKHHTTVELIDRLEKHGYVRRSPATKDRRQVLVHLTRAGAAVLRRLSLAHRQELETAGPAFTSALRGLRKTNSTRSAA
jgi:DNA-binding MarR family transcriptional regulator